MSESITIWTVGHSTRTLPDFFALLRSQDIRLVADVRQFPGSRRHPHFGKAAMSASLNEAGFEYAHFPELGGRRKALANSPNVLWRNEAFRGYADYMQTDAFQKGVGGLLAAAARKRTCIMCAEALWWRCHRGLIADYLKAHGHRVLHILSRNKVEEHPYTSAARIVNGGLSYAAG